MHIPLGLRQKALLSHAHRSGYSSVAKQRTSLFLTRDQLTDAEIQFTFFLIITFRTWSTSDIIQCEIQHYPKVCEEWVCLVRAAFEARIWSNSIPHFRLANRIYLFFRIYFLKADTFFPDISHKLTDKGTHKNANTTETFGGGESITTSAVDAPCVAVVILSRQPPTTLNKMWCKLFAIKSIESKRLTTIRACLRQTGLLSPFFSTLSPVSVAMRRKNSWFAHFLFAISIHGTLRETITHRAEDHCSVPIEWEEVGRELTSLYATIVVFIIYQNNSLLNVNYWSDPLFYTERKKSKQDALEFIQFVTLALSTTDREQNLPLKKLKVRTNWQSER